MGAGADLIYHRRDRGGHPVPLRQKEGFAEMEFCSEERAGNAQDEEDQPRGKDAQSWMLWRSSCSACGSTS
jgi:hypothetical protein